MGFHLEWAEGFLAHFFLVPPMILWGDGPKTLFCLRPLFLDSIILRGVCLCFCYAVGVVFVVLIIGAASDVPMGRGWVRIGYLFCCPGLVLLCDLAWAWA
jgi:hypothetical protein